MGVDARSRKKKVRHGDPAAPPASARALRAASPVDDPAQETEGVSGIEGDAPPPASSRGLVGASVRDESDESDVGQNDAAPGVGEAPPVRASVMPPARATSPSTSEFEQSFFEAQAADDEHLAGASWLPDDRLARKRSPEAARRRAELVRYVKMAVAVCALILVVGVLRSLLG